MRIEKESITEIVTYNLGRINADEATIKIDHCLGYIASSITIPEEYLDRDNYALIGAYLIDSSNSERPINCWLSTKEDKFIYISGYTELRNYEYKVIVKFLKVNKNTIGIKTVG